MAASPPVVMKLLIVAWDSNDGSYQALTHDLGQIGVPYQAVFLNNLTPDGSGNRLSGLSLVDSANGRGLFQGIIETDSSFSVCTTTCSSLLSATDVAKLNSYAVQYSVRMVCYYGWPDAAWGLQAGDSGASYTAASPLNVTLTAAGAAVFPYLTPSAIVPVSGQGGGIWAYRAMPTAAANETTTPILAAGAYTVGVTHTTADGRETMALTMDNYPGYLHSTAFSYGVINWITKGVFLGYRRVYLGPQIDDLLNGNLLYAPTLPQCPNGSDPSCPRVFTTGDDLVALANWQTSLKSNPLFSTFHSTFAYNGIGSTWFPSTDPVFTEIAALNSQFTWVTHTWDHPNLDCFTTDSNGNCVPASLAQSQSELSQNIALAPTIGMTLDGTDMVTPFNGGLTNSNFLQAAAGAGIQNIVMVDDPPGPQLGLVSPLNSSIFLITRREPDMYVDVSSPLTGVYGSWPDEYNAAFGPSGTTPIYNQDQTYAQIIDIESGKILNNNMLTYEPYPLAFHIGNSSLYDGTHSIYTDLLDAAIAKYTNLFSLPVLTLDLKDIAPILKMRASFNTSGVVGVYTPGVSVALTTTNAASIPVTGACSEAVCASYGGQIQDTVSVPANSTVTLSLTATAGTTPASVSLNPTSVQGGNTSIGTVTLSSTAPTGGASVSLSSDNAAATVPASVTVPAGGVSSTFTVTTTAVTALTTATVSASYNGLSKTAALTVTPPASVALVSISLNPASVASFTSSTGTVTLSGAAPAGGVSVSLSSNSTSATVPASVTVAAGSSTATFTVTTQSVAATTLVTITGVYNGVSMTGALTIAPSASTSLSSVSVNPASVTNQTSTTGTVTLSQAAPAGGVVVALWTTGTIAYVPAQITIAAGSTTGTFTVTTNYTSSTLQDTVTAFYNGVSQTANVTVTP